MTLRRGIFLGRVHAISINPLDYLVRRGEDPDLVQLPASPDATSLALSKKSGRV